MRHLHTWKASGIRAGLEKRKLLVSPKVALITAILLLPLVAACSKPEELSETHLKKGLQLIAEKNDLDARLELLNSIKYKSDNVAALRALAGVNERTGAINLYVQ